MELFSLTLCNLLITFLKVLLSIFGLDHCVGEEAAEGLDGDAGTTERAAVGGGLDGGVDGGVALDDAYVLETEGRERRGR